MAAQGRPLFHSSPFTLSKKLASILLSLRSLCDGHLAATTVTLKTGADQAAASWRIWHRRRADRMRRGDHPARPQPSLPQELFRAPRHWPKRRSERDAGLNAGGGLEAGAGDAGRAHGIRVREVRAPRRAEDVGVDRPAADERDVPSRQARSLHVTPRRDRLRLRRTPPPGRSIARRTSASTSTSAFSTSSRTELSARRGSSRRRTSSPTRWGTTSRSSSASRRRCARRWKTIRSATNRLGAAGVAGRLLRRDLGALDAGAQAARGR